MLSLRALSRPGDEPWRTGPDLLLIAVAGLGAGLLHTLWLAEFVLLAGKLSASPDFLEYCTSTDAVASGDDAGFSRNRSRAAALLPGLLARRFGIEDGLLLGATVSSCVISAGVALWARAAHSRLAGVAAALLVGAVGPLAVLGRTLTFYPEVLAGLVLSSATGLAAWRWRTVGACLAAGCGAGLALLLDQRGLIWALPTVGLGLAAALWGPGRRPRLGGQLRRLGALVLPLWLSFHLGTWAYPEGARSLEAHANPLRELQDRGFLGPEADLRPRLPTRFVWGRTDPRGIPASLATVAGLQALVPPEVAASDEAQEGRRWWVRPWEPVLAGAVFIVVLGLRRRPLLALAFAGLALPYALSLESAVDLKRAKPRFLANGMLHWPPLLGVGLAVLAQGGLPRRRAPARRPRALPLLAGAVVVLLLVLGAIPSWLSPVAEWRVGLRRNDRALWRVREAGRDGTGSPVDHCVAAIERWPARRLAP
jgi:hypothetical protein